LLASLTPVLAQGFTPAANPSWVRANDYGRWALQGQSANTYTFQVSGFSPCTITQLNFGNSSTFYAFSDAVALAPVLIQDNNQANSEVVTPGSYLAPTETTCGPTLAPSNAHTTFSLQSGTGGLQEALNVRDGKSPSTIILDGEWYSAISNISQQNATLKNSTTPADVIGTATCVAGETVIDVTTTPWTSYGCNASSKLVTMTPSPKVSIAAGAGAGTSPTIAIVGGSSQGTGTVTLTTGTTPTASAAVFTVTFPPPDYGGGFVYAGSCTVTSVGSANTYSTEVVTSTAGSATTGGTLVFTASSTALTASVAYKFTYSCH
jgi:hypothetical protein